MAGLAQQHRFLLVLRFGLLNVVGISVVTAFYLAGWLDQAFTGHTGWLCAVVIAVFVWGLALCASKVWRVNLEHDDLRAGRYREHSYAGQYFAMLDDPAGRDHGLNANLLRLRLGEFVSVVRNVAGSLVLLGLIGTVVGFIVALSGVAPQSMSNSSDIAPMVTALLTGMSIALYTTLIGAVLHLWLMMNHRLLAAGCHRLFDAIVTEGESRVGVR